MSLAILRKTYLSLGLKINAVTNFQPTSVSQFFCISLRDALCSDAVYGSETATLSVRLIRFLMAEKRLVRF